MRISLTIMCDWQDARRRARDLSRNLKRVRECISVTTERRRGGAAVLVGETHFENLNNISLDWSAKKDEISALRKQVSRLREENSRLAKHNEKLAKDNEELGAKLAETESDNAFMDTERVHLYLGIARLEKEQEVSGEEIKVLRENLFKADGKIDDFDAMRGEKLRHENDALKTNLDAEKNRVSVLKGMLEQAIRKKYEAEEKAKSLLKNIPQMHSKTNEALAKCAWELTLYAKSFYKRLKNVADDQKKGIKENLEKYFMIDPENAECFKQVLNDVDAELKIRGWEIITTADGASCVREI